MREGNIEDASEIFGNDDWGKVPLVGKCQRRNAWTSPAKQQIFSQTTHLINILWPKHISNVKCLYVWRQKF